MIASLTKWMAVVASGTAIVVLGGCSGSASTSTKQSDASASDATMRLPDGRIVDAGSPGMLGDPGCGFDSAAFCDTFDTPSPGGRAGDLNDAIWLVARVNQGTNPTQGNINAFPAALAMNCDGSTEMVSPPDDYRFCSGQDQGSHLIQTFDDGGFFAYHSFAPRRPFDFAGRTGTIRFDTGGTVGTSGGHGWWIEIWIVDEPVPAPYQEAPSVMAFPRNGIGLKLGAGDGDCGLETRNALSNVFVMRDYELITDRGAGDFETECFDVSADALNRYELRIDEHTIELWVSPPGDHENVRRVARVDNLELPFTRGFVHFQHTHYNAAKDDRTPYKTYHWDNIGFDGPVYPIVRGYDVPDALEQAGDHGVNLGYYPVEGSSPSDRGEALVFTVQDVDIAGAQRASIDLNINSMTGSDAIAYRVNEGAWQEYAVSQLPIDSDSWRTVNLPVEMSSLRSGANTIELAQIGNDPQVTIANISLNLRP